MTSGEVDPAGGLGKACARSGAPVRRWETTFRSSQKFLSDAERPIPFVKRKPNDTTVPTTRTRHVFVRLTWTINAPALCLIFEAPSLKKNSIGPAGRIYPNSH
jgi:hypothetical protein